MRDPVQRNVPPRPGGGGGDAARSGQPAEQSGATGTMSIGEVLGILKPEFPDITVSKIRFLEGAGLVQPDRSASGYRKFSEDDVARLRFVLRAQRDQYLPLRVIRQRLADLERVGGLEGKGAPGAAGDQGGSGAAGGAPGGAAPGAVVPIPEPRPGAWSWSSWCRGAAGAGGSGAVRPGPVPPGPDRPGRPRRGLGRLQRPGRPGLGRRGPRAPGPGRLVRRLPRGSRRAGAGGGFAAAPPSDAQFTRDELCRAAGANVEQLLELESFGLVSARGSGDRGAWYGGDDLVLLRLARELADYGLEARHLRMYKLFAEREAALFEQVVAPLVRQRNPEARARARDTIDALAQLGGRMRDLALRSAVHGMADSRDSRR